eukprot:CAMPEP_0195125556 /NCGR_PEP_ID=MMETSP0448-20130528/133183_1 /TAXON_ID=66468 /ORGANISM="Heterocapsa triquestra, Strain CCMP 448" /LENGTH=91 /DNA_ID=CAMNT_0040163189 /DNA_START=27 /DNA_END=299 /DNA_ORIENTATION=+
MHLPPLRQVPKCAIQQHNRRLLSAEGVPSVRRHAHTDKILRTDLLLPCLHPPLVPLGWHDRIGDGLPVRRFPCAPELAVANDEARHQTSGT